ncbi:dynein intermediate chain 2, ciliary [Bemisia tabaci]|uniref:dynein intermediate chain 2, ciliary n=1 Tax=Bemisia tabaci TaxID=7038 RepID=UPI003B28982F
MPQKPPPRKPPPVTTQKSASRLRSIKSPVKVKSSYQLREPGGEESDPWLKGKSLLKPDDQLDLSEKELQEEITRSLVVKNPLIHSDWVEYSYKDRAFISCEPQPNFITVQELESKVIHVESPEAADQLHGRSMPETPQVAPVAKSEDFKNEIEEEPIKEDEEADEEKDEEDDDKFNEKREADSEMQSNGASEGQKKKLTNQFNFSDRAALTSVYPTREIGTQTIPPPRNTLNEYVTQWIIYDTYQQDYEAQQREKEKERVSKMTSQVKKEEPRKKSSKGGMDPTMVRLLQAAKIIERMVNQNLYDEISQDFRYYEDPSDEFRDGQGTLLPLWKFSYEKTKKLAVTDLRWSPRYYDLFGATFGSFNFEMKATEGYVCLFTLKNPSFPEYINYCDSGAMCLDIHSSRSNFIVVGRYDGSVAVYNAHLPIKEAQFESNSVTNKHGGIVWQVCWGPDLIDGDLNFFSVSADGKVCSWIVMQNELSQTLVIHLLLNIDPIAGPNGNQMNLVGCGTAISFHPENPEIFLVGTEEGNIYKCSTAYASLYLFTYEAHHMPVYRIEYNKYSPDIFISCGADWRVKIWEDGRDEPLFVFDLGCSVGDVKWAPYSSTVFAAVTEDCRIHVFDLNVNKYRGICVQNVVAKNRFKLSRLAFNWYLPVIIIGDDKGFITTVKLSPNLRVKAKPPKKNIQMDQRILEQLKLEKLLALVREPTASSNVIDAEQSETSK